MILLFITILCFVGFLYCQYKIYVNDKEREKLIDELFSRLNKQKAPLSGNSYNSSAHTWGHCSKCQTSFNIKELKDENKDSPIG